jgi:iron(III) transport system permease protein
MAWNTALLQTLFNSVMVAGGAAIVATVLGLCMAMLTVCYQVHLHRWLSGCVLCLVLVPVYVQATAWSAGFGLQGWLRLSQVAAAISPVRALLSVVWIHGTAATPICYLLCVIGIHRSLNTNARQALIDFGPAYAMRRVVLPTCTPWIFSSSIVVLAMVGNDMVVTNLYQLPTVTESLYQQVQFNEIRSVSVVAGCSFALLVGLVAWRLWNRLLREIGADSYRSDDTSVANGFRLSGRSKVLATGVALAIVLFVVGIPLINLVVKGGWESRLSGEVIQRSWSLVHLWHSIGQATSFSQELSWSVQLSICSTIVSMPASIALVAVASWLETTWFGASTRRLNSRRGNWAIFLGVVFGILALPGPIVNLVVLRLTNGIHADWFAFLVDRTLAAPVVALQFRSLPIALVIMTIAMIRFESRNEVVLQMDRGLRWTTRAWIYAKALMGPWFATGAICFFVAFADLSSYLLVQPPGVTTVAMRMFDLLHYGVKNQDAGLALVLALVSMLGTWAVGRAIRV